MVVTLPDHRACLDVIQQVKSIAPKVQVFARARSSRYVPELTRAGASETLDEELNAGVELGRRVIATLL